jgi:hypothetical protein
MCLIRLEVTVAGVPREQLSPYCGSGGSKDFPIDVVLVEEPEARLELFPKDGCGCDFLVPDANLDSSTYPLRKEACSSLSAALDELYTRSPRGIAFTATRYGDPLEHTERVRIGHLLRMIRSNRVGSHTRYLVRKT